MTLSAAVLALLLVAGLTLASMGDGEDGGETAPPTTTTAVAAPPTTETTLTATTLPAPPAPPPPTAQRGPARPRPRPRAPATTIPSPPVISRPPAAPVPTGFVRRHGRQLVVDGRPYRFSGINAYFLANYPRVNNACGPETSDAQLDQLFASLRPGSMVRFWAFQQAAWNKTTRQFDFTAVDRVLGAAQRHGQRVIMTIAGHLGGCEGPEQIYRNESWYAGGYRQVQNNSHGSNPLSYWDWLGLIVSRYKDSPVVGMWEPMNEAELYTDSSRTACSPTAASTLRAWLDAVGGEIHRIDPNHLVSSGLAGNGQCGANHTDYEMVHRSPGVDVASYHDYLDDADPFPGDRWNGLELRIDQMARVGKPLLIGEAGIRAGGALTCKTVTQRRDQFKVKMDGQFGAGVVGFLPWSWWPTNPGSCQYENITGADPTLALLRDYPL